MNEQRGNPNTTFLRYWAEATLADGTEVIVGVKRVRGYMSEDRALDLAESLAKCLDASDAVELSAPEEEVFV